MGGEVIAFDTDTGKQTSNRTLDDCTSDASSIGGGLTVLTLVDCNDYTSVVGAEAVEANGHVLAKTDAARGRQAGNQQSVEGLVHNSIGKQRN